MKLITGRGGCHVLLKEVSSYEEAFYEMRRFLEVNDIYSNRTCIDDVVKVSTDSNESPSEKIPVSPSELEKCTFGDDMVVYQDVAMWYSSSKWWYYGKRAESGVHFRIVYAGAEHTPDFDLFRFDNDENPGRFDYMPIDRFPPRCKYYLNFEDLPAREVLREMNHNSVKTLFSYYHPYSIDRGLSGDLRDQLFYDEIKVYIDCYYCVVAVRGCRLRGKIW